MVAKVHRLRTKPDRLKVEQGEALRQMVLDYGEPLPGRAVGEILIVIDRNTEAQRDGWRFVLMGPEEFNEVADWLEAHSKHRRTAVRLFRHLFRFLDPRTQEILRTREELAELARMDVDAVSKVMGELVGLGVLRKERTPIPGIKGPGLVHWYMNPKVATHLAGKARDHAQAKASPLKLDPKLPKFSKPKLVPVE